MPNRILHPEWRDSLRPTKYPFSDTSSLTNGQGDFVPNDLFLDASLYVIGAKERLHISKISVGADTVVLAVSDVDRRQVAKATFNLLEPPTTIQVLDLRGRPAGILVAESAGLAVLQSWSSGDHEFALGAVEFAARTTIPTPEIGVRGFLLADGSLFTGDVWLVGEDGIVLSNGSAVVDSGCGQSPGEYQFVRVDVVGEPLYRRKLCDPLELFQTPRFLKILRLQRGCDVYDLVPDAHGNINVTVGSHAASDTVLRVRTTNDGIIIETVGKSLVE